ncbi:MAG: DUF4190 domain-containing protein [Pyrinomonadaceae bacterium]
MKQCPVCEKTFEDNMRFCQADGTPLVDMDEPVDPFKTMVASKEEILAAMPKDLAPEPSPMPEPSVPAVIENEVLEIPPVDPNKTQFVSEAELRAEMDARSVDDEQVIEMPPVSEPPPPKIIEQAKPELPVPEIGGAPPPSPLSAAPSGFGSDAADDPFQYTTPPIPSPFGGGSLEPLKEPKGEISSPKVSPPVAEPEPELNPFDKAPPAPIAQAEFNPPVIPESNMQNPQFTPPAVGGQSQTLAIVSLVIGILSLCCGYTFIVPIIAIVLGFVARGKANSDPANFTGGGLALGGIITGAVALLLGIVVIILNVVMGFGGAMLQNF